jgi:hypothetical protein
VREEAHFAILKGGAVTWEGFLSQFSRGIILFDALHPVDMYRVFHVFDLMAPNEFALAVVPYALICLGTHIYAILA